MSELLVWTRFGNNSAGTVDFVMRLEPNLPSDLKLARQTNFLFVLNER